jgi:hypothetical protein
MKNICLLAIIIFIFILLSSSTLAALLGDFNSDGKVDFEDLMIFALAYGSTPTDSNWNAACDLEPDNKIDFEDLMLFAMNYGKEEPPVNNITQDTYYATIQEAIDASTSGDEIVVSPGTYYENITLNARSIILRSVDPSDPAIVSATVIDGNQNTHVVEIYGSDASTLEGFTIRNGISMGGGGISVYGSSPTIKNNTILNNESHTGGGIQVYKSNSVITNNRIDDNSALYGGGIYVEDSTITISNNSIINNKADNGKGGGIRIFEDCTVTVTGNTINDNSADEGGGIYVEGSTEFTVFVTIIDNEISSNNAETEEGGGIYVEKCITTISGNKISSNEATVKGGGGIYLKEVYSTTINNNDITDNICGQKGGGIHINRSDGITIENNKPFSGNRAVEEGGGMYVDEYTQLSPIDARPGGWGGIVLNIPTGSPLVPAEGTLYPIAGNEFIYNVTGVAPGIYTEGAHVYFDSF